MSGRMSKTGRSKGESRHVRLHHWMLNSEAWKSLPGNDRAIFLEIAALYNGGNNGQIAYSVRTAADSLAISPQTAMRALQRLQERGFIVLMIKGAFSRKARHASEWRLTEHLCDVTGEPPTKNFMNWKPPPASKKTKHGACGGTKCFPGGTVGACGGTAESPKRPDGASGGTIKGVLDPASGPVVEHI
jgi:hypothetical protein